jgi:hypothetical protein
MLSEFKLSLQPVTTTTADASVISVLEQAQAAMGFLPNMYANMANAPSLLKSYLQVYDLFRKGSAFSPIEQKVIFLTISRTVLLTHGLPSQEEGEAFIRAGYTERHVMEIILAIALKTMSNYSNHLFHTPVDGAFAGRIWAG